MKKLCSFSLLLSILFCLISSFSAKAMTYEGTPKDFKTAVFEAQNTAIYDVVENNGDETYKINIVKVLKGQLKKGEMLVKCEIDDHQLIVGKRYISLINPSSNPNENTSVYYCSFAVYDTGNGLMAPGYTATGFDSINSFISWMNSFKIEFTAKSISIGKNHALAIDKSNKLWAWGSNDQGQLGISLLGKHYIYNKTDAPIEVMKGVKAVSAGSNHSLIIDTSGNLWSFGANGCGQLGTSIRKADDKSGVKQVLENGTLGFGDYRSKPIKIMSGVKQVAAGDRFSLALKADGSVWSWGLGKNGRLGNGKVVSSYIPKKYFQVCLA